MTAVRYLTVEEYAALAGVSHKTIRGMIKCGELPAHRYGRILRIDPEEAHAVTAYQPPDPKVPPEAAAPRLRRRAVRGGFARRARGLD